MPSSEDRLGTSISNGRLLIYAFILVFVTWSGLTIWHFFGGPPGDGLIPIMTTLLGLAVTVNSVESKTKDDNKAKAELDLKKPQDDSYE